MFSDDELYVLPAKPLASWTDAELQEQLELYEAKKLRRAARREVSKEEIQAVIEMQSLKLDMMAEMLRRRLH